MKKYKNEKSVAATTEISVIKSKGTHMSFSESITSAYEQLNRKILVYLEAYIFVLEATHLSIKKLKTEVLMTLLELFKDRTFA